MSQLMAAGPRHPRVRGSSASVALPIAFEGEHHGARGFLVVDLRSALPGEDEEPSRQQHAARESEPTHD